MEPADAANDATIRAEPGEQPDARLSTTARARVQASTRPPQANRAWVSATPCLRQSVASSRANVRATGTAGRRW